MDFYKSNMFSTKYAVWLKKYILIFVSGEILKSGYIVSKTLIRKSTIRFIK